MIKPKYFSENQVTLDDKKAHARLSPYMSVLIIKNHVKEGVELARRFKLPQKVVDFIPQHHGSGLIRYFTPKPASATPKAAPSMSRARRISATPAPKPQAIETAIVLLSDSVEAIAASKFTGGQVSEGELRRMVQMTISEKFNDGQFDECDLTLRHLHLIREAFVKTLMARYPLPDQLPGPARHPAAPAPARRSRGRRLDRHRRPALRTPPVKALKQLPKATRGRVQSRRDDPPSAQDFSPGKSAVWDARVP